ncbi:MAG: 30S ribosomal protein S11, partial [Bacteroidetes bacterium]|nr:30S ribosomal protein S11 [Bacteroidota bacterium]
MAKANKKNRKNVKVGAMGYAYVQATFNNIIITLTNEQGQVISWGT